MAIRMAVSRPQKLFHDHISAKDTWPGRGSNSRTLDWNQSTNQSHLMTKPTKCAPSEDLDQPGRPPVWSEFSLSAWRKLGSLAIYWAHSEDSDQTRRMSRLIWVFAGRTCHFVGFVMRWLSSNVQPTVLPRLAENDEVVMGGNFFLQFNYVSA